MRKITDSAVIFSLILLSATAIIICSSAASFSTTPLLGDQKQQQQQQQQEREQRKQCKLYSRQGIPISGVWNETLNEDNNSVDFCSFYRIPYAKAPVKKFRFQKAQMVRLFNAKSKPFAFQKLPPQCLQEVRVGRLEGQEDCLFVNVFTKKGLRGQTDDEAVKRNASTTLHPVVLWIHGGTFALGSGLSDNFNPSAFIEEDIVVVSFNYRLDLFGFFPVSPDEPYSMNLGLDDQKVALKWIRKHIKIFGGDPNRVTIMGWSAGSASVNFLLYDEEAKGLFHSAIAMSGSFLSPWSFSNYALQNRELICEAFQVRICTVDGIVSKLGANFTLLTHLNELHERNVTKIVWGTVFPIFAPAPQYPGDSPELRMRMGPLNDVPLLIGVTSAETRNFELGKNLELPQSTFVFPNDDPQKIERVVQMLQRQSEEKLKEHLSFADLYYGVYKFVELHSKRTQKNVYFYRFNYNPEDRFGGAAHGDDIRLLFKAYDSQVPENAMVARSMQKMWANFIKYQ